MLPSTLCHGNACGGIDRCEDAQRAGRSGDETFLNVLYDELLGQHLQPDLLSLDSPGLEAHLRRAATLPANGPLPSATASLPPLGPPQV